MFQTLRIRIERKCSDYIADLPQVGIPIGTLRVEYFGFAWTLWSVLGVIHDIGYYSAGSLHLQALWKNAI